MSMTQEPQTENAVPSQSFSLTVRDIQQVHGLILKALTATDHINLAFPDDAPADLSFIQVVESARLYADLNGKTVTLARPASPQVRKVLERGGFLAGASANRYSSFWLHEEVSQ